MKILVFSDSHRKPIKMLELANKLALDVGIIVHLGDCYDDFSLLQKSFPNHCLHGIAGNCDFNGPPDCLFEQHGKRIWLTHGHRYGVKGGTEHLAYEAAERGADICLFGHTHIASAQMQDGIWLMNPGSIAFPRGYERESYGIIDITEAGNVTVSVVETSRDGFRIIYSI